MISSWESLSPQTASGLFATLEDYEPVALASDDFLLEDTEFTAVLAERQPFYLKCKDILDKLRNLDVRIITPFDKKINSNLFVDRSAVIFWAL